MRLRACLAPGALALLLIACGGTAELVPLPEDVGLDPTRPLAEVRGLTCTASVQEAPFETTCFFEISTVPLSGGGRLRVYEAHHPTAFDR